MDYDGQAVTGLQDVTPDQCNELLNKPTVTWVHVQGRMQPEMLGQLGERFDLHNLALEDVVNTGQRPKAENYDNRFFVILSKLDKSNDIVHVRQVSLLLDENLVISFYDGPDDPFIPVRKRIRAGIGKIRKRKADFLLYALIDLIIDEGFPILEQLGVRIEELEDELLDDPAKQTLDQLHILKRELLLLRWMVWPHRELLNTFMRDESPLIEDSTYIYLRDCYYHTIHILDLIETYRDMTASMLDVYLSSVSHKLNESMRLLTVIATIFIPLTFIVGVYGMNFDVNASPWNMPELGWRYGYPLVWLAMIVVVAGMLFLFKRRNWL